MPSQKPKIVIYTDEETKKKIEYIAQQERRTSSNYVDLLLQKHILEYEQKNGKIKL